MIDFNNWFWTLRYCNNIAIIAIINLNISLKQYIRVNSYFQASLRIRNVPICFEAITMYVSTAFIKEYTGNRLHTITIRWMFVLPYQWYEYFIAIYPMRLIYSNAPIVSLWSSHLRECYEQYTKIIYMKRILYFIMVCHSR